MTAFDDEFYRDILEGLAVHSDSDFVRDILRTLTRHQAPSLAVALNKNQMASKRWLVQCVLDTVGPRLGDVLILGGWVGALGAVLLQAGEHHHVALTEMSAAEAGGVAPAGVLARLLLRQGAAGGDQNKRNRNDKSGHHITPSYVRSEVI